MTDLISVEVAYALPDSQQIIKLEVPVGTTVGQAVEQSGIDQYFDDLCINSDTKMGVWGKFATVDRVLNSGERVEIYRPLLLDPKELRKARAARAKAARDRDAQTPAGSDVLSEE